MTDQESSLSSKLADLTCEECGKSMSGTGHYRDGVYLGCPQSGFHVSCLCCGIAILDGTPRMVVEAKGDIYRVRCVPCHKAQATDTQSPFASSDGFHAHELDSMLTAMTAERDAMQTELRYFRNLFKIVNSDLVALRAEYSNLRRRNEIYRLALESIAQTKCEQSCDNRALDAMYDVDND